MSDTQERTELSKELFDGDDCDLELCQFIDHVLRFCGHCVNRGTMKAFEIKNKDVSEVYRMLKNSSQKKEIVDNYNKFITKLDNTVLF